MPAATLLGRWVKMASGHRFENGIGGIAARAHREGNGEVGGGGEATVATNLTGRSMVASGKKLGLASLLVSFGLV